ncbi:hypothetical protein Ga0076813_16694, partial [endosymbiont of Ridgeia piscesae]
MEDDFVELPARNRAATPKPNMISKESAISVEN